MQTSFNFSSRSFLFLILIGSLIPSCVHEPVKPAPIKQPLDSIINPIDTTQIPPDTTTNPVDTTQMDTVITPCHPDTVYFERDVLPVLISNCAKSGCHDETTRADGVVLTSFENTFSTGDVIPGDPEESDLYERLVEDRLQRRMPPAPAAPLAQDQIDLIFTWISQGAQNLSCGDTSTVGECDTTDISYSVHIQPVLNTYCVGCHKGANPSGGVSLDSHVGVAQVAASGKLLGSIYHLDGFVPMPQNGDPLSACTIAQVKAWVDSGTPDN